MKKVIYYQGIRREGAWDSTEHFNSKVDGLEKAGYVVERVPSCRDYDLSLRKFLDITPTTDVEMIVGCSLGGFWANKLACKYNIPVLLINPQLLPLYYTMDERAIDTKQIERTFFLAKDDDILDYRLTQHFIETNSINGDVRVFDYGQHHFGSEKCVNEIVEYINNYVPCD
jgi:predicted esterase YcpF (UPF0227 family)